MATSDKSFYNTISKSDGQGQHLKLKSSPYINAQRQSTKDLAIHTEYGFLAIAFFL